MTIPWPYSYNGSNGGGKKKAWGTKPESGNDALRHKTGEEHKESSKGRHFPSGSSTEKPKRDCIKFGDFI